MKKLNGASLLLMCLLFNTLSSYAQDITYRRSSLTMVLIEDDKLGKSKDLVIKAYESNPFPDKYNNHVIKDKKFDPGKVKITTEDYLNSGFYKDTLRSPKDFLMAKKKPFNTIRYLKADNSEAVLEPSSEELLQIYLDKYIKEKDLAKQVVGTWFNRTENGKMDFDVIKERGKYSASAEKLDEAKEAALEVDFLMDWDLISNTYTIFHKMQFFENEPVAAAIREAAKAEALAQLEGKPEVLLKKALEGIEKVYEKTKEGYTVKCISYLYQLDWNDEIAQKAKSYLFNNEVDPKTAWDTTSLFKMNFVGQITSNSIVTFKLGEKRTEEQIIDLQVKRTMDNALAKLQKKYVQFRPVAPVSSVEPLTARIGMKEGLEPGQTYEILKLEFDQFGIPKYKQKGTVKVEKKQPIWDNRQGADEEELLDENGAPVQKREFTQFAGGKNAEPYINFLRLIK
jgi:hypothetical protein